MGLNSLILIHNDQVDWIMKNPDRFVNGLVTRIQNQELDRHPGYARWNGDGMPGVQVVWVGTPEINGIVSVGNNSAHRIGITRSKNDGSEAAKIEIVRQMAEQLGYTIRKKTNNNKKKKTSTKKQSTKTKAKTKTSGKKSMTSKNKAKLK